MQEATQTTEERHQAARELNYVTLDRLTIIKILLENTSKEFCNELDFEQDASTKEGNIAQMMTALGNCLNVTINLLVKPVEDKADTMIVPLLIAMQNNLDNAIYLIKS